MTPLLRPMRALAIVAFSLLLPSFSAAQTTPEGAAALKSELQVILDLYNTVAGQEYGTDVYFVEEIAVTPAGDNYEVLLRNLRMAVAEEDEAFGLALGDISMTMAPLGDQRYRVGDLGPLSPFVIYGDSGQAEGQMSFTAPRLEGVLSTRYMSFLQMDAGADAMEVAPLNEPGLMRSGLIAMKVQSDETSPGVFDQKALGEIRDITFQESGAEALRIDRVLATSEAREVDAEESLVFMEQLAAGEIDPESFDLGSIVALLPGYGDSRLEMEGFNLDAPDGDSVSIGRLVFGGGYAGGADNMGSGAFEVSIIDIAASGPSILSSGLDARLIPTRFTLKTSMDQLPNDELLAFFTEAAATAGENGTAELDPNANMTMLMDLTDAMAAAGSTFTIDELTFANQVSALAGTGRFRANAQAAMLVDGGFRMQVAGVSNLQAMAQEMAASSDPEKAQTGQAMLGMLGFMMIYAQGPEAPEPTVEGALAFDIKLRPDGSVTVNGTPLLPPQGQQ